MRPGRVATAEPREPSGEAIAASPSRTLGLPRGVWVTATVILAAVVAIASLLPPRGTPVAEIADLGELRAWVGHAVGYLLLTATAMLAQRAARPWLTVLLASSYGVALELLQGVLGQRSAQLTDVVANVVGALLGVAIASGIRRRS